MKSTVIELSRRKGRKAVKVKEEIVDGCLVVTQFLLRKIIQFLFVDLILEALWI